MQHVGLASFVLGCNCSITQSGRLPPPVSISHIFMGGDERQPLMASFVWQFWKISSDCGIMPVLFCEIISRARKAWVPGDATELARRNWLCSAFSCGVELSCAGTLADDTDRSSAPHQAAGLAGNTPARALQMSWFLELAEELGLFGKITLCFLCPWQHRTSCAHFHLRG